MKDVKISKMTLEDFEEMKNVLISDFDDFWSPEILKSELMGENKRYIVAKENGEIVGFAGILQSFPEIEIMNIVTKKEKRHGGIGTMLLQEIIENANYNHFEKIFLEVKASNQIARKLYEKAGFVPIGVRKKYYQGEDAILMECKIS